MKKYLIRLCNVAFAVLLLCHLNSCKDPSITDKGNTFDLDPINLSHIDTLSVQLNTVADLPLLASGVSTGVLGSMDDPYFGKTFAGFYAQCLLSANGAYFDSGKAVDSAVLYMPFVNDTSKYGNCAKPIDVIVYEVNQYMDPTVTYNSNDAFSVYGQAIGRLNNYIPDLIDSPVVRGYVQAPSIHIKLTSAFAQKLLNTDSNSLSSSTNFINYLKGIYVTTNTAKPGDGVSYISLQNSAITLYYHNVYSDTLQFNFPITSYSVAVNHFDHQYGGKAVQTALSNPAPAGDKVVYLQAGSSTRIKLKIPNLTNLPTIAGAKSIGITKAELIMPVGDTVNFHPPQTITFYRLDDTLGVNALNSYNNSGVGTLTTRVDNTTGNSYLCYVFSLTEYIQRVLNKYYNNDGFFVEYSYSVRADRVILKNDATSTSDAAKTKLKITYTKLQ